MSYILPILGIVGSVFMLIYREWIGNLVGEAEWMNKVGGVYNFVVLLAVLVFFWSLAVLTGTTFLLLQPILWLFPGLVPNAPSEDMFMQ